MRSAEVGLATARPGQPAQSEAAALPADLWAGFVKNTIESAVLHAADVMPVTPQSLRDPGIIYLRAELRSGSRSMDDIVAEINKWAASMELARSNSDLPQKMLSSFSDILNNLISKGETMLNSFESKHSALVTILMIQ